jgi:hypothetical protein
MRDVFISHVEEDSADALEIADALEVAGYSTWCYERDSIPGPSYLLQTGAAVEQSRAIVVLISRHSLASRQVTVEVVRGHESEKPFIPVLVGISHVEFTSRQPEWREAMGAATSIMVPREGAAPIVPRIVQGLQALGVEPTGAMVEHRVVMPAPVRRRRGPVAAVIRMPAWQRIALALGVAATVVAVVVTATLLSSDEPAAGPGGGSATTGTTDGARLRTIVGDAQVTGVSLADEFCPPGNFPGGCDQPASGKFLVVTLTGANGGVLTIGVTQQSTSSYVTHGEDRYGPSGVADESRGVVRIVYDRAPDSLAGEPVTLVWPDGQKVKLRVAE